MIRKPDISPLITRRRALAGIIAATAFPAWSQALPSNPDVTIIGAGAAGLAAARQLINQGLSVVVLEARNRIGGRAFTESSTFGVPFDHGCSWIHAANRNPFKAMADDWGFTTHYHDEAEELVYMGDRQATVAEETAYENAWKSLNAAVSSAGRRGLDVEASSVSPREMPWIETSEAFFGPMDMGVDMEDLSTGDWWGMEYTEPNYLIREGFGTLVSRFGHDIPVRLKTPVERVRWGGKGVILETAEGTITSRACIITASTGVLNAGTIGFDPVLPAWKQDAIARVPMGLLAKIPLQFKAPSLYDLPANAWLSYYTEGREACYFLCRPFGFDIMIGFIGGSFAWELSGEGSKVAVDFARKELRKTLGSGLDKHFVKGTLTNWANDPWSLGAYSAARPGHALERGNLKREIDDKLYFAGEACADGYATTCGGAFINGQLVARRVAKKLSA